MQYLCWTLSNNRKIYTLILWNIFNIPFFFFFYNTFIYINILYAWGIHIHIISQAFLLQKYLKIGTTVIGYIIMIYLSLMRVLNQCRMCLRSLQFDQVCLFSWIKTVNLKTHSIIFFDIFTSICFGLEYLKIIKWSYLILFSQP